MCTQSRRGQSPTMCYIKKAPRHKKVLTPPKLRTTKYAHIYQVCVYTRALRVSASTRSKHNYLRLQQVAHRRKRGSPWRCRPFLRSVDNVHQGMSHQRSVRRPVPFIMSLLLKRQLSTDSATQSLQVAARWRTWSSNPAHTAKRYEASNYGTVDLYRFTECSRSLYLS